MVNGFVVTFELKKMKLVWSPESASKAYIDTVKTCQDIKESGVAELLSAMAAGWNAKLIVEAWTYGGPITTSVGLAIAARHTCARHVCIVPDERSRVAYAKAMYDVVGKAGLAAATEVIVMEEADEEVMGELKGVDFLAVDCKRKDFGRVLRFARFSNRGAVVACQRQRISPGFRWQGVLSKGARVVRSVFLPVGQGVDIVHVGSSTGSLATAVERESLKKKTTTKTRNQSRWITHVDQRSGEEHVYRGMQYN